MSNGCEAVEKRGVERGQVRGRVGQRGNKGLDAAAIRLSSLADLHALKRFPAPRPCERFQDALCARESGLSALFKQRRTSHAPDAVHFVRKRITQQIMQD